MPAAAQIAPFLTQSFSRDVRAEVHARREAARSAIRKAAAERGDEVRFIRVSNRSLTVIAEALKDDFRRDFAGFLKRRGVPMAITLSIALLALFTLLGVATPSNDPFGTTVLSVCTALGFIFFLVACLEDRNGPFRRARRNLVEVGDFVWGVSDKAVYLHHGEGKVQVAQLRGIGEVQVSPYKDADLKRVAIMDLSGDEITWIASPEMDDGSEDAVELLGRHIARFAQQ